ncbi:MAG: hypothetical protein LLF83_04845 [Methanobacterium sp.]|nr:hypothetical protein [Methanobacterium sp.]
MSLLDDITNKATKELDKQMKGKKHKHKKHEDKHKDDQIKNIQKIAEKELKKRFKI